LQETPSFAWHTNVSEFVTAFWLSHDVDLAKVLWARSLHDIASLICFMITLASSNTLLRKPCPVSTNLVLVAVSSWTAVPDPHDIRTKDGGMVDILILVSTAFQSLSDCTNMIRACSTTSSYHTCTIINTF